MKILLAFLLTASPVIAYEADSACLQNCNSQPPPKPEKPTPDNPAAHNLVFSPHGGVYIGPGDVVAPPTATGGTAPTAPGGPARPGQPTTPTQPRLPGVSTTPTQTNIPIAVSGTEAPVGVTPANLVPLDAWTMWWQYNAAPYLGLKAKVYNKAVETASSGMTPGLGTAFPVQGGYRPTPAEIEERVVPVLLDLLRSREIQVDLVSSALIAIAKAKGGPAAKGVIESYLSHDNQEIAETAALSLAILQEPTSIGTLLELLHDSEIGRQLTGKQAGVPARTRAYAAFGLGFLGRVQTSASLKQQIAEALLSRANDAEEATVDVPVASALALGILRPPNADSLIERLGAMLPHDATQPALAAHLPTVLARIGSDSQASKATRARVIQILLGGTEHRDSKIRQSSVQSLGIIGRADSEEAAVILEVLQKKLLKGTHPGIKHFAAIAIAKIASRPTEPTPMSNQAIAALMKGLAEGSSETQPWCGLALGTIGFERRAGGHALPNVASRAVRARFIAEKSPQSKAAYAVSLGLMRSVESAADIWASIQEMKDPEYLGYAAMSLGLMEAREYRDGLVKLLESSRRLPELYRRTAIGLGLLGERDTVNVLLAGLQPDGVSRPPLGTLSAAAEAVGFVGDVRAISPLIELSEDPEMRPLSRAFAVVALGMVADTDLLPFKTPLAIDVNYTAATPTLTDFTGGFGVLDIL